MKIKYPIYAVMRNYHGIDEIRYIYRPEEIIELETKHSGSTVNAEDLDGMCGSFWSDDTYEIMQINNDADLVGFLMCPSEGICDYDNPPVLALAETWSHLSLRCMYTDEESEFTKQIVAEYTHDIDDTSFRDTRYYKLLDAGMSEYDFYLPCFYGFDDDVRYYAVMDALERGVYKAEYLNNSK